MIKIKIWGIIAQEASSIVESALSQLSDKEEPVLIILNSPGGTLQDSVAICNLLEAISNPIITVAIGTCASAAAMIFSCGQSRYIGKNILYMIHQPLVTGMLDQNFTELNERTQRLQNSLALYKSYITSDTNIPEEKLNRAFKDGKELYLSHNECLEYNIATDLFTTWEKLYVDENIKITPDDVATFEIITSDSEE